MSTEFEWPLTCEFFFATPFAGHPDALRRWLRGMAALIAEALVASNTISACEDLFDSRLWGSAIATGFAPRPTVSRLTSRTWDRLISTRDLHGLNVSLRPLPQVPERRPFQSSIEIDSGWHPDQVNSLSFVLPGRYVPDMMREDWAEQLLATFSELAISFDALGGHLAWARPMRYLRYPLGEIDFSRTIVEPGWSMFLADEAISGLGGAERLKASALFSRIDPLTTMTGRLIHRLVSRHGLTSPEMRDPEQAAVKALRDLAAPILLPDRTFP